MISNQTFRSFAVAAAMSAAALLGHAGAAQAQQVREFLNTTNIYGVNNGVSSQPAFAVIGTTRITEISTYHWNFGRGQMPGSISLRSYTGQTWGPFPVRGSAGQNNAQNVNWTATPNVDIPGGTYFVVDSSPATWSSNAQSSGRGFAKVYGYTNLGNGGSGSGGSGSGGSGSGGSGSSGYGFTPCAANSNPVAVVGPCVVKRGGTLNVFEVRPGIVPARLQFLANTPYSTAYNVIVTLTPAGGSHYTMTVPPQLCGPGSSTPGFSYNVFLLDSTGKRQGQIGTFTPDCR